ncbi:MAG: hypothetical protein ACI85U_003137, partial [Candidatus Promineifilaceae bacterium]
YGGYPKKLLFSGFIFITVISHFLRRLYTVDSNNSADLSPVSWA